MQSVNKINSICHFLHLTRYKSSENHNSLKDFINILQRFNAGATQRENYEQ